MRKNLTTREARRRLKRQHAPHWARVHRGLMLGWRRHTTPSGTWYVRWLADDGKYHQDRLGVADDKAEADGEHFLTYQQALERALKLDRSADGQDKPSAHYTVWDACQNWLDDYKGRSSPAGYIDGGSRLRLRVKDTWLGRLELNGGLKTRHLERWVHEVAQSNPVRRGKELDYDRNDPEAVRKRRSSARKTWSLLRAALNRAYSHDKAKSPEAWRRFKFPFKNVDAAKIKPLDVKTVKLIIRHCDPDFRPVLEGAMSTGARYGELIAMRVGDYHPDSATVELRITKSAKPRMVPLTDDGVNLFERLTAGRKRDERMLTREDGSPWRPGHQARRMRAACERAGVDHIGIHMLRHAYGGLLAQQNVPLQVIAVAMGHADSRMTEKHYAHLQPDFVADTIRAAMPKLGFKRGKVRRIGA